MKPSSAIASVFALGLLAATAVPAFAQATPQNPDVLPAAGGNGPANAPVPSGSAPAAGDAPKVTGGAGGYSYSDKPRASTPRGRYRATGPTVAMPGFEPTADGGSRFFVQLSQSVTVEERKAQGSVTYVLKGASPRVWNNTNSLVTVHFNTPVARARLVPQGKDLLFVLDLRAAATPTWKMGEATDKGAQLNIDFAKGDYVSANDDEDNSAVAVDGPRPTGAAPAAPANNAAPATPRPRTRTRYTSPAQPRVRTTTRASGSGTSGMTPQ